MSNVRFTKSKKGGDVLIVGDYLYNARNVPRSEKTLATLWSCWKVNRPTSCRGAVRLNRSTMEVEVHHEHNHAGDPKAVQQYEDRVKLYKDHPDKLARQRRRNERHNEQRRRKRGLTAAGDSTPTDLEKEEDTPESPASPCPESAADNSGLPSSMDSDLDSELKDYALDEAFPLCSTFSSILDKRSCDEPASHSTSKTTPNHRDAAYYKRKFQQKERELDLREKKMEYQREVRLKELEAEVRLKELELERMQLELEGKRHDNQMAGTCTKEAAVSGQDL